MGKIKFEGNPPYALPMVQNVTARADMSAPPGRVVRGVQRALLANPGRELTTRELWEWTHPRGRTPARCTADSRMRSQRRSGVTLAPLPFMRCTTIRSHSSDTQSYASNGGRRY
jgi:hypothetical protein